MGYGRRWKLLSLSRRRVSQARGVTERGHPRGHADTVQGRWCLGACIAVVNREELGKVSGSQNLWQ